MQLYICKAHSMRVEVAVGTLLSPSTDGGYKRSIIGTLANYTDCCANVNRQLALTNNAMQLVASWQRNRLSVRNAWGKSPKQATTESSGTTPRPEFTHITRMEFEHVFGHRCWKGRGCRVDRIIITVLRLCRCQTRSSLLALKDSGIVLGHVFACCWHGPPVARALATVDQHAVT